MNSRARGWSSVWLALRSLLWTILLPPSFDYDVTCLHPITARQASRRGKQVTAVQDIETRGHCALSAMLTVSQLSKSFAGRALFDDVSLQVNRGGLIKFQF